MKLKNSIKEYISFSRNEQRGIIVLLILLLLVASANRLIPESVYIPDLNYPALERELKVFEEEIRIAFSGIRVESLNTVGILKRGTFNGDRPVREILTKALTIPVADSAQQI